MDSVIGGGVSNDIDGFGGDGGEEADIDVTWKGKGKSNDINDLIHVRVDGMVVSGQGEGAGMGTSGWESGDSNDVDGWNRGRVDVIGGYEACTDAESTCRWLAQWPHFPRPLMGGTLIGGVNDDGLMDGPEDVDDFCVKCMGWSFLIAHKTLIAIWWVFSKSSEITICDTVVIYIRKWNIIHLHII